MKEKIYTNTVAILQSSRFFYATIVLFVIETSWIALSGVYPMAYDENTHLNIIQLYTHHWLPFWSQQPNGPATYGAVTRDPSYMYQYLLSFPYRLLELFIHGQTTQVIILRFVSIILFGLGIILYRKILLHTKASKAIVHTVLALFVLTPTVPFLAAQINYDNLLFPCVALALLLTIKIIEELKQHHTINLKRTTILIILSIFASLVKYAFLPFLMIIVIWLAVLIIKEIQMTSFKTLYAHLQLSYKRLAVATRIVLVIAFIVSLGLFMERYGINTIRYGTPTPECNQVLSITRCEAYGPWYRNYLTYQDKVHGRLYIPPSDPFSYSFTWIKTVVYQLFYTLNGQTSGFISASPLILPMSMAIVLGIPGVILVIRWQKKLRQTFALNFLIAASLFYIAVLWAQQYTDFRHIGLAVAIQARYLVPVLPVLYLILCLAYAQTLRHQPYLKAVLAWFGLGILLLEGGGAAVFILRSNASWYWPSKIVLRANQVVQTVLRTFVIGS